MSTSQSQVLRIGREPDNDFVVKLTTVSGYHARVMWSDRPGVGTIEDLRSTNGTAVNDPNRREPSANFTAADTVYLGEHAVSGADLLSALAALGGSASARSELRIGKESVLVGRDPACDRVINEPVVSSRHARMTRREDGSILVEDLKSANGTFINGRRIDQIAVARPGDTITFGSHSLAIALDPTMPPGPSASVPGAAPSGVPTSVAPAPRRTVTTAVESRTPSLPTVSSDAPTAISTPTYIVAPLPQAAAATPASPPFGDMLAGEWKGVWNPASRPAIYLALGPLLAVLAVLTSGFDPKAPVLPRGTNDAALATLLSRLGLVAVGLGLIGAVGSGVPGRAGLQAWLARSSVPALLSMVGVLLAWIASRVLIGSALGGAETLILLGLGGASGLAIGLFLAAVSPTPAIAWAAVAVLAIPLWALGGDGGVWKQLPGWAKTAAAVNPSRWAFEGLLLGANDQLPPPADAAAPDVAEPYFPAETERIGPRGALMALFAMALGWGVAAAFIAASPRVSSPSPPGGRPAP